MTERSRPGPKRWTPNGATPAACVWLGNGKDLQGIQKVTGEAMNAANVVVATPFAMATLLPPEIWNAIAAAMKMSR